MVPNRLRLALPFVLLVVPLSAYAGEPVPRTLDVGGVARGVLVYLPATVQETPAPVIVVFHGHGGSGAVVARRFALHELWPEAIVLYPSGLPSPGKNDPEGKRPGWQKAAGEQGDRDLAFLDAMLAKVKEEAKVDETRIYATGHSNGAAFTYLACAMRPVFAAIAPSAGGSVRSVAAMKPTPVLHFAGEKDEISPFAVQQKTMDAVRALNQCDATGTEWAPLATLFASKVEAPFVAHIHAGGHELPEAAPALIVRFFKEHARKK